MDREIYINKYVYLALILIAGIIGPEEYSYLLLYLVLPATAFGTCYGGDGLFDQAIAIVAGFMFVLALIFMVILGIASGRA